ncbi:MAG: UDP-N-acetylglucosamine--N-acetylmuramyl-(pentapeptide) pyrophosphoryl-undecaprenol N-acetylglucosamine transferase [Synergistaceae bacterium]|nr:UDP-N-acetylglucosamine--N-acetylmuramyl-(pentapeptide) pyrophosphoryl-undecaprenol N-acetylglucosamine transferase [Synergistaceae bacterium]
MQNNINRVLIVSGGTGGHIFPAAVFGKWLEDNKQAEIFYMCGSRALELEIYKSLNIKPYKLSLSGSPLGSRSPVKILKRLYELLKSFYEALKIINKMRPDYIFLFGGYISFMPLVIAKLKHVKLIVHEQNAAAGRVTRIAAKLGVPIAAGWQECFGVEKIKFITAGIPVREPVRYSRGEAIKKLNIPAETANKLLKANIKIIGVAGGSLGSRSLMNKIFDAAKELSAASQSLEHEYYFLMLGDAPKDYDLNLNNIYFTGRQWDMNPFYSLCDALICRAGGSTLAEALTWHIPAISVPWPGAAENHQVRNANCFYDLGGGLVYHEDQEDARLAELIIKLFAMPHELKLINLKPCEALAKLADTALIDLQE